jgi:hypothetical protein
VSIWIRNNGSASIIRLINPCRSQTWLKPFTANAPIGMTTAGSSVVVRRASNGKITTGLNNLIEGGIQAARDRNKRPNAYQYIFLIKKSEK